MHRGGSTIARSLKEPQNFWSGALLLGTNDSFWIMSDKDTCSRGCYKELAGNKLGEDQVTQILSAMDRPWHRLILTQEKLLTSGLLPFLSFFLLLFRYCLSTWPFLPPHLMYLPHHSPLAYLIFSQHLAATIWQYCVLFVPLLQCELHKSRLLLICSHSNPTSINICWIRE